MSLEGVYRFNRPNGDVSVYTFPRKEGKLVDLKTLGWKRRERQRLYFNLMKAELKRGETITPGGMGKLMARKLGLKFQYVGQDMVTMTKRFEIIWESGGHYSLA